MFEDIETHKKLSKWIIGTFTSLHFDLSWHPTY